MLEEDVEDQHTRNIFTGIRKNITTLRQDLQLILAVIRKLRQERRWTGTPSRRDVLFNAHEAKADRAAKGLM